MSEVIITIHDEVRASVRCVDEHLMHRLDKHHAIPVKNHFFNPSFTTGAWDGKYHFFNEATGYTFTQLLPNIIEYLDASGYNDIQLHDKRKLLTHTFPPVDAKLFNHIIYPDTGEPVELAEHQMRCANSLLPYSDGIVEACTGAGKTILTGALCTRFVEAGLKTLVIVPSLDLIENTCDELLMLGFTDVGVLSGTRKDPDHPIVVSTWQTLSNLPIMMTQFSCVLVDETHGARGDELQTLLNVHGKNIQYRYGMTGTIPDDPCDAMKLHVALGPVRAVVTADELIKIGWLSTLEIEQILLQENLTAEYEVHKSSTRFVSSGSKYKDFKQTYFPDYKSESSYVSKKSSRHQWLANRLDTLRQEQGNTFVLVTSITAGKKLASLIPNCHFVHGVDKVSVRKQIYELFRDRDDVLVIATVGIASTGINIKRIFNLVLVDLGKSFIRTIQSIGRGLRKGKDKNHLRVYDIGSDLKYGNKHAKDRERYYKQKHYPFKRVIIDYEAS